MRTAAWILVLATACSSPAGDAPDAAAPDAPREGCGAATGTLRDQMLALGDGIEDRAYWMHVPAAYDCASPAPLLVDFHGTAGAMPEEAYQTDAMVALSEAHGVIVVRPRSRSSLFGGEAIYRWDENPGDLARNVRFTTNLVTDLEARYAIDPARVYASGFSTGSNMAAQFLLDPGSPFHGLAPIAGGLWSNTAPLPAQATGPRVWLSTGYRDYLWPFARDLSTRLATAGLPPDRLVVRHTGGGHDLYPWQIEEMWQFLDQGVRPAEGALAAPWTAETVPSSADVIAVVPDGADLLAAGGHGRVWRRTGGAWALDVDHGAQSDYAALCAGGGHALAGGQYLVSPRADTGWSVPRMLPDFGHNLGAGWANAAVCREDGSVIVAGYWSAAITGDAGMTWTQFAIPSQYPGVNAQIAGGAQAPGGATVLVGYYDYIGRAAAGETTTTVVTHATQAEWWNAATAVAGGRFWVVGDGGAILASADDGRTWTTQTSGTTENLYGVHFADAQHGAAVGLHGTVIVTSDGGAHWGTRPLGLDAYVGGVVVGSTTITVVGERGVIAVSPR